jgi:hypothetical protein
VSSYRGTQSARFIVGSDLGHRRADDCTAYVFRDDNGEEALLLRQISLYSLWIGLFNMGCGTAL